MRVKAQTSSSEKDNLIEGLRSQINSLEKKHDHAHASLIHFREAVAEQMKTSQEQLEQVKSDSQQRISLLKESLTSKSTELIAANQHNSQLADDNKVAQSEAYG